MSKQIICHLEDICGIDNIITNQSLMSGYLTDWRNRYTGSATAIVFPTQVEQIRQIVNYCRENNVIITPQGGNTSTCGGATPNQEKDVPQIIINFARLNNIIEVDTINQSITVEAGVTLEQVQLAAAKYNLYFPLSLASQGSCQIGGNIATNAGGIHVLKYGMMRDLTLGIEAVLANAEYLTANYKLHKNNTYIDLKQLLIGSEGTLGLITKATLKLYPQPVDFVTFLIGIPNLNTALNLLALLRRFYASNVNAFEVIKSDSQILYEHYFPKQPLPITADWIILGELEINTDFNQDTFISLINDAGIDSSQITIASNARERKYLWSIRENIPIAEKQHGYAAKHDISLPLGMLEPFLATNMQKLIKLIPNGYFSIFGHLGDGNLHYNFGIKSASQEEVTVIEKLVSPIVYQDIINMGGSISAEHGIGQAKKTWFKDFCPTYNYQLLKTIKQLLDPNNQLNPGKIF